ncbi:MAG: tRNA lysidine(34) synthetase TilS [Ignavibacteria bacterium]|jgi:tRNA(Ile)-lysidine synthase
MKTNLKTIEQKVLKSIDSHFLIESNDKILLGLSGGADSVFAFYFLLKFKSRLKIEFACAHLNHGLRGIDADADEKFCSELCLENNINFFSQKVNTAAFAKENNLSVEEAGRELRYNFFNNVFEENGYSKIVTAHHLSDNVETILYNFFKGAGLKGLTGIPEKRDKIIRPFLSVTREEIEIYLTANRTKYCIDKSNYENDYKRNFIRNKILPLIKKEINPAIENTLSSNSEIIKSSLRLTEKHIRENSSKYFSYQDNKLEILIRTIEEKGFDFLVELAKNKLKDIYDYDITSDDFFKIKSLAENQAGKKAVLKNGLIITRNHKSIIFEKEKDTEIGKEFELAVGSKIEINDVTIGIEVSNEKYEKTDNKNVELISADNLDNIFILRRWKHGDYFYPLGMKGKKKVSDFLTDLKFPSNVKKTQLVLTNNDRIIWVVGLRIDERFKINQSTKKILKLWKQ